MKCSNPNCSHDTDGSCAQELGDACPHLIDLSEFEFISPDDVSSDDLESNEDDKKEVKSEQYRLTFCGQVPLSITEAQRRLQTHFGKVISFIGPVGVGKTTLIASLFDAFSKKNQIPVSFGGSDTIYAFENLCHHARVSSRSSAILTPRTSSTEGVAFYHLSISDSKRNRQEILLADRSGESYAEMLDNISLSTNYDELLRSDLLLFMVDSSKLSDKKLRHQTRRDTQNLIQLLFEDKFLGKTTNCALVLTKYDLVAGTPKEDLCLAEANRIIGKVQNNIEDPIEILPISAQKNTEYCNSNEHLKLLWEKLECTERKKIKISLEKYKTNRSFHNLELINEY